MNNASAHTLTAVDYPQDVLRRAQRVRLVCFDVDGTLTDGRLIYDSDGREQKQFHAHDGQGLTLLRDAGVPVAMITARASRAAEHRAAELQVQIHTLVKNKLALVIRLSEQMGIGLHQIAFMGDDLADMEVMRSVGFAVAPANAHHWVVPHAHWRTTAGGGYGAARELCDLLLHAQGHLQSVLRRRVSAPGVGP